VLGLFQTEIYISDNKESKIDVLLAIVLLEFCYCSGVKHKEVIPVVLEERNIVGGI